MSNPTIKELKDTMASTQDDICSLLADMSEMNVTAVRCRLIDIKDSLTIGYTNDAARESAGDAVRELNDAARESMTPYYEQ